jgi:hypothetical protein
LSFTYPSGSASSNFVRQPSDIPRIAHEDGCFDGSGSSGGERDSSARYALSRVAAATNSIVEYLTTLARSSFLSAETFRHCLLRSYSSRLSDTEGADAYLRISYQHQLRAWALRIERVDGTRSRCGSLVCGLGVAHTAAGALSSAGRVDDGLRRGAAVSGQDEVHDGGGRAVSLGDGGLASAEDVDAGAGLALLDGRGIAAEQAVGREEEEGFLGTRPHLCNCCSGSGMNDSV